MFRKLREAIDAALTSLEARTGGEREEEKIDRLLAGMRDELIEAKARLPVLDRDLEKLQRLREQEVRQADDCVRRASQAREIGDAETVEVAERFAAKHVERAEVLGRKIEAARADLAMQRRSVEEMTSQLKEAKSRRSAIAARSRRSRATSELRGGATDAASRFDRMVERLEDEDLRREAEREMDETLGGQPGRSEAGLDPDELAELRLRELKRRMAEEGKSPPKP
jgi:phage shock protein A